MARARRFPLPFLAGHHADNTTAATTRSTRAEGNRESPHVTFVDQSWALRVWRGYEWHDLHGGLAHLRLLHHPEEELLLRDARRRTALA